MAQKVPCCPEYNLKEVAMEALSLAGLGKVKIFQVEQVAEEKLGKFQGSLLENGLVKARVQIFCVCFRGKCDVDIFVSQKNKELRHWRVALKDSKSEKQRHFMVWRPDGTFARAGLRSL